LAEVDDDGAVSNEEEADDRDGVELKCLAYEMVLSRERFVATDVFKEMPWTLPNGGRESC
jgi:hypothetical protein